MMFCPCLSVLLLLLEEWERKEKKQWRKLEPWSFASRKSRGAIPDMVSGLSAAGALGVELKKGNCQLA
jgi:hypothetical protein